MTFVGRLISWNTTECNPIEETTVGPTAGFFDETGLSLHYEMNSQAILDYEVHNSVSKMNAKFVARIVLYHAKDLASCKRVWALARLAAMFYIAKGVFNEREPS